MLRFLPFEAANARSATASAYSAKRAEPSTKVLLTNLQLVTRDCDSSTADRRFINCRSAIHQLLIGDSSAADRLLITRLGARPSLRDGLQDVNIGFAFNKAMLEAVAINVLGVVITSSPAPISKAR